MARKPQPYIDRGKPGLRFDHHGRAIRGREVPAVPVERLPLSALREKALDPRLQQTHRTLLRWSENAGTGMPNPEAETRETHYDPLPPDIQVKVTEMVDGSPWQKFVRKIYSTTLERGQLFEQLGLSRTEFYSQRKEALWYFRGRFESAEIYG